MNVTESNQYRHRLEECLLPTTIGLTERDNL